MAITVMSYHMSCVTILSQFTFCTRWLLPPRHRRLRGSDPIFRLSTLVVGALRRAPKIYLLANIFTSWTMEIQMYTSYDAKLANHCLIDKNIWPNLLGHQVAFHKCKSCKSTKSNLLGHQVAALHHLPRQLAWPVAWLISKKWEKLFICTKVS